MPTYSQMCSNVVLRLGDPRANRPGIEQVLNEVSTQVRTTKRHRRNTGNVWDFNETEINVVPGISTYAIAPTDFGTPLAVISWAPFLATFIARLIPHYTPQNMPYDWGWPNAIASYAFLPPDGSQCTAQRCAFYWRDNQPYIEFQPTPQQNAGYKIKYLQNASGTYDAVLDSTPVFSDDSDLIEVRSALALLPISEWMSPDTKEGESHNLRRQEGLRLSLAANERELTRQFEASALVTDGPRLHDRFNPCAGSG